MMRLAQRIADQSNPPRALPHGRRPSFLDDLMSFGFLNLVMLFGLIAVVIPPLIHLLNRRRYNVVDWGAMQFLQISETTRRRLLIEEILLMLLRMGLIAVLVMALATPFAVSPFLAELGGRPNRDVVLVIDGSYSMGLNDGKNKTPHEAAKEWATDFLKDLSPGDSVVVLHAKQQVVPILGEPTHDLDLVREKIAELPPPRGGCDWPAALREAHQILAARSKRPHREIIVLSDGQRFGWADSDSLFRWEKLASDLRAQDAEASLADEVLTRPRIWVVNVRPESSKAEPPNYWLAPLTSTRAVAWVGQKLKFKTALGLKGHKEYEPPYRIRLEVDGKPVTQQVAGKEVDVIQVPRRSELENGKVPLLPLTFAHRFDTPGSHLVSVIVEPDPPPEQRPPNYQLKDYLPGDNRQDIAVEVVASLPVLLVDGESALTPESSTYFLRKALGPSPGEDRAGVILTQTVPVQDFDPALLTRDLDPRKAGSKPRVLVLADVPKLTMKQQEAVEQFLADGGGVLVVLGERMEPEAAFYNEQLYHGGQGWLPARLDQVVGDPARPERAATVDLKSFHHPALELFREEPNCTLGKARFPRWWRVATPGKAAGVPRALLTNSDPLLVEKTYKGGRVLLCTVPLDRSWGANLPSIWEYPVLAHELFYYLADARSADRNVPPGQPLRYRPERTVPDETPPPMVLYPPEGKPEPLTVENWPLVYKNPRETGVYRLEVDKGPSIYFVVQADHRESDVTTSSEEDRKTVSTLLPMTYQNERQPVAAALAESSATQELWWWFLIGVVLLLCGEVWMTRRMVKGREATA
jgi:hypothetical protein